MIYATDSVQLRIAWTNKCIADLGWRYLQDREGGKDCTCTLNKIIILIAYVTILCSYDEDQEFNILTAKQVGNIEKNISNTCEVCFNPNY